MDDEGVLSGGWTKERLHDELIKLDSDCCLAQYNWDQLRPPLSEYQRAAVLIPLFIKDGDVHVWLTKRSHRVGADKGHVAFPGGMRDPEDADESATCLREAKEEIGLRDQHVCLLARTLPRVNSRDILVSSRVGVVSEDFVPTPNEEVQFAFHLPLRRFLHGQRHKCQEYTFKGSLVHLHYFTDTINDIDVMTWGLTAAMCTELAVSLLKIETDFDFTPCGKLHPSNPYESQNDFLKNIKFHVKI